MRAVLSSAACRVLGHRRSRVERVDANGYVVRGGVCDRCGDEELVWFGPHIDTLLPEERAHYDDDHRCRACGSFPGEDGHIVPNLVSGPDYYCADHCPRCHPIPGTLEARPSDENPGCEA